MRLKITCLALLASMAACLGTAAVATAASSPTATATKATAVTNTSAKLNATIDPNGAKTTYYFSHGPTSALGTAAPQHSLAAGTKTRDVSYSLTGLSTGTTYYYDVTAVNAAGTSVTKTVSFKTKGHAPASATTGGPLVLSSTSVTLTGTVSTADVATDYYFEYGTTTAYGTETAEQTAAASTSPTTVSVTLTGLAPGTVFYYALVAKNGPNDLSTGAPAAFETFPDPVPTAGLRVTTTPRTALRGPYTITSVGRIIYTNKTNPGLACAGDAEASYYDGSRLLEREAVPVDAANCTFRIATEFKTLPVRGLKRETLKVYVRFNGNHYFKARIASPELVTLG